MATDGTNEVKACPPAGKAPAPAHHYRSIRIAVFQTLLLPGRRRLAGITLNPDEIELLRLIDLEDLEQEEAAEKLGVSRKTAWRDLHEARRKIADALVRRQGNRDGRLHEGRRKAVARRK